MKFIQITKGNKVSFLILLLLCSFFVKAQNVGIGTTTPAFPLSFAPTLGDKISLWSNSTNSYGFGIQGSLLQIHTDISAADIAFGYGSSAPFTEIMRIKGSGNVGIGITNPVFKLDVANGSINTDAEYRIGGVTVLTTPGTGNLFVGKYSGEINTGIYNSFFGQEAGNANTAGQYNSFFGQASGYSNISGYANSFYGLGSGLSNMSGFHNSFFGEAAGNDNTEGSNNSFFGRGSGINNSTGSGNSGLGEQAYYFDAALENTSCIGFLSGGVVNESDRIEIGNSSVSVIAGHVGFSTFSDERIKKNVNEDVPGLAFITKLRPVTYNLDIHKENEMLSSGSKKEESNWDTKYDIEKIKMTGFLAQEVEQAAKDSEYDFSGVQKPDNPDELYSLRYSDFVMPLVKAVQEQQKMIDALTKTNQDLLVRLEALEKRKL